MRKRLSRFLVSCVFLLPIISLFGCGTPNMKGTWTGASVGIKHGKTDAISHKEKHQLAEVHSLDMILEIKEQNDRLIEGTHKSPQAKERIIGVIAEDNKSIYFTDEDSFFFGKLLGPNKLEMIYMEVDHPTHGIARAIYTRKKEE